MIRELPELMAAPSVVEVLRLRARQSPAARAYTFLPDGEAEGGSLTWAELDWRARAIAAAFQARGLQGERALLLFPPGLDFVAAFFGCLYAGTVAVPAYPPRSERHLSRLLAIAGDAQPRAALVDAATAAAAARWRRAAPELDGIAWIDIEKIPAGAAASWRGPDLGSAALAFLQYTSGSTSAPKGVMVSHGNLAHNERVIQSAFQQDEESVDVGWLPLYHDMGLIGNVLQPLWAGGSCVLMPPLAFLQRPRRWLEAIGRYRATTSGGPDFAYDLCLRKIAPGDREGLDLSSWQVAFNGAEPVRAETQERFAAAFAACGFRSAAFYPCYGLAEATLFVAGGTPGLRAEVCEVDAAALAQHRIEAPRPESASRTLVSCGRPWQGQAVEIVDPQTGRRCAPGEVGEIWVAGESVTGGYWNRPDETAAAFGACLPGFDGDRFLRTGDLGFDLGGELFVTGRLKDLIILRGRNHYPQDFERTVESCHPALRPGCGAAFSVDLDGEERLVVAQEVERTWRGPLAEVAEAVRRAVAEEHEVRVHEVVLLRTGGVPKTSRGKVRRQACRATWLAGELAALDAIAPREGAPGAPPSEEASQNPVTRETLLALPAAERAGALTSWLRRHAARVSGAAVEKVPVDRALTGLGIDSPWSRRAGAHGGAGARGEPGPRAGARRRDPAGARGPGPARRRSGSGAADGGRRAAGGGRGRASALLGTAGALVPPSPGAGGYRLPSGRRRAPAAGGRPGGSPALSPGPGRPASFSAHHLRWRPGWSSVARRRAGGDQLAGRRRLLLERRGAAAAHSPRGVPALRPGAGTDLPGRVLRPRCRGLSGPRGPPRGGRLLVARRGQSQRLADGSLTVWQQVTLRRHAGARTPRAAALSTGSAPLSRAWPGRKETDMPEPSSLRATPNRLMNKEAH
jgi:acyl-CoA synthetase (AMP-forming)/AMP-acid ligase II